MLSRFGRVRLFVTPWTVARLAPLSMGFSRQEYWSELPCPPPGDLSHPGIEPASLTSPALAGGFFTSSANQKALAMHLPVWKDVILLWKTDFQSPPSSAHLFYHPFPSALSHLSISLEATLLIAHWVPSTWNSSLLSSWFMPTHPWRQSPFFCYAFLPRTVHFFPCGLSRIPLQFSTAHSSFCPMNLFTFCNHQLPSLFSTWLWTLWMLKWDYAFYLCVPRLGSNEWMHWKSVSQKDWKTFLCQCSSKSKAHFYQNQMSWLFKMQTSGLCPFCFTESGDGALNLHLKRAFPHLILISIIQSWEPLPCRCWVLAERNTEASHAQISKGFLLKFPSIFTAPTLLSLFSSLSMIIKIVVI